MKGINLVLILIGGGLYYVHSQQPDLWNKLLVTVGMQAPAPADAPDANTTASVAPPANVPITPTGLSPVRTEVITPDSTYMTSDHVRQVVQPVQPGATAQQTASTTTPAATPAPAQ